MNTTATVQTNRQLILDEDLPESFSKRVRVIVMPENDQEFDENAGEAPKKSRQQDEQPPAPDIRGRSKRFNAVRSHEDFAKTKTRIV